MAITFFTQNLLLRLRRRFRHGVTRGLLVPAIVRGLASERLQFERQALEGHANELQVRAELFRDSDDWLEMASLQLDLLTESRIRLQRDRRARQQLRRKALRRFKALIFGQG